MTNVCPRCRSKELEVNPISAGAKCHLCGWQGHVADCLAVTSDGMIIEKVMEGMVRRLSGKVAQGLTVGIIEFAREYQIRIRREDLQRILAKIVALCLRSLHDELLALAPKNLQEKVRATNMILAADEVARDTTPAPVEEPEEGALVARGVIDTGEVT